MTTRLGLVALVLAGISAVAVGGCAADSAEEEGGDDTFAADSDLTGTIQLPAQASRTVTITTQAAQEAVLTIDCQVPANPDEQGAVFNITSADLGIAAGAAPRAGYFQKVVKFKAGKNAVTFQNLGRSVSCGVRTTAVPANATCRAWESWRSPNTDHTHVRVGVESIQAGWEPLPASGNHWGAWAAWSKVYDKPVKPGFFLHNLEHGGIVFSYKCSAATQSAACKDARDQLVALANAFGQPRVLVTPDPTQQTMFAIRGWRSAYASDCLDTTSARAFVSARYNKGREDIDADPPIPYDPTTTNVPCENLMAAPDSCAR